MTERYGYGDDPGGGERPSGRGAIAERRAGQDEEVREIDLTDEAADREQELAGAERPPDEREASGAFEPHPVAASTSIFDVGREEETAASGPPEAAAEEAEREAAEAEATDQAETEAAEREAAAATAEGEEAEREATAEASHDEAEAAAATAEPEVAEPEVAEPEVAEEPAAPAAATAEPAAPAAPPEALFGSLDAEGARNRFLDIQAGFVDEPHQAVEEAGRFVDELVQQVTDALRAQRGQLQAAGDDASTEDLRLTLRAYRQFVDRLLGLAR
jgi:hypothetical protein